MKTSNYLMSILAVMGMISCNKTDMPSHGHGEMGTLEIRVVEDMGATKAVVPYTDSQLYETDIYNVQLLVFDEAGDINVYKNIGGMEGETVSTTAGKKIVWAVVNGPDLTSIKTESQLKAVAVKLEDNSKTGGFVMTGRSTCTVGTTTSYCPVPVSRLVSRIALKRVSYDIPMSLGALEIKNVFISNVVGNQNLEGSAAPSTWYNKEGRADEENRNSTHIINGTTYLASCPELTFNGARTILKKDSALEPDVPYLFYAFPNNSTNKPNGFSTSFSPQRTVLVISATIDGRDTYYPIPLDKSALERNKTYTMDVTITGFGSDDPNKEIDKGNINVAVNIEDWLSGATYEETI